MRRFGWRECTLFAVVAVVEPVLLVYYSGHGAYFFIFGVCNVAAMGMMMPSHSQPQRSDRP